MAFFLIGVIDFLGFQIFVLVVVLKILRKALFSHLYLATDLIQLIEETRRLLVFFRRIILLVEFAVRRMPIVLMALELLLAFWFAFF